MGEADKVELLFENAKKGKLKLFRANEVVAIVKRLPIEFVDVDENLALTAGRIKAMHSLAYADAFVVATAIDKNATIVTGDKEFEGVHPDVLWINR